MEGLESRPSSADALAEGCWGPAPFGDWGPGLWPEVSDREQS
jgi:hypothetical protein